MTVHNPLRRPGSARWYATLEFARLTGTWVLGLLGLYVLYMWTAFVGLPDRMTTVDRLVMVAGPMVLALSFFIPPAVFAAARDRFDLSGCETPGTRASQWALLVAFALVACTLAALAGTIGERELMATQGTPAVPPPASPASLETARSLLPVAIGLFTVVSGFAGALVGHVTLAWHPRGRTVAHWFACLALVVSFLLPMLIAGSFIMNRGAWPVWTLLGPLFPPVLLTALLAWRERRSLGLGVATLGFVRAGGTLDPRSVDRIVSAVADGSDPDAVAHTRDEREMAQLASAIRRIAAPAATVSERRTSEIVRALQAAPPRAVSKTARRKRARLDLAGVGGFCAGWTCLAAWLLLVGLLGGVPPTVGSAVAVGCVGSAGIAWIAGRRSRPTAPASP